MAVGWRWPSQTLATIANRNGPLQHSKLTTTKEQITLNRIITAVCLSMLFSLAAGASMAIEQPDSKLLEIGQPMPAFELQDFRGKTWNSEEFKSKKAVAIVFFGVECPLVKLYVPRLAELGKKYGKEFQIVGINSNRHDSITEIANFAKRTGAKAPLLKDPANRIADAFGASRTPEVFLFDSNQKLAYHGAIDDQYTYGQQRHKAKKNFLADAVEAVLAGQQPETQTTQSDGCIIGRILKKQTNSPVTYANQVSRILNDHCVSCHRPGEVAPFSLTDYDEVVGWAEMIAEVVDEQRMPPWHANPLHGKFKNDTSLSVEEKQTLSTWVENGAPMGDTNDLPEPPKFVEGWRIGTPDVVIAARNRPYHVPATGVIDYQHFVVDPGFKEDKWIQAAEIRIGNRAVVHHVIVAVHDKNRKTVHGEIESEWITAAAPGSLPLSLPEGYAKVIPAGSKLIFQMHYTPNGTAQTDVSSVGFKFVDREKVRKVVGTGQIRNKDFVIPEFKDNYPVAGKRRFYKDTLLLALFPHMHLRGKSFRYTAYYQDKIREPEILLDIPRYDFNWQTGYQFETPKLIPAGTVIECVAHFDNSEKNFANPNPAKAVRWGDQTWDEMMIGYYDMALADQDLIKERSKSKK